MTDHRDDMDHLDERVRAAAHGFRDEVADTVDLAAAHPAAAPTRGPVGLVVAALVVLALVAAGVLLQDDGDVEVAVDEDDTTTTEPERETAPDVDAPTTGLALGAPDDGKDSVGLPVDADPKTGLVDGQTVTVVGAQFPPNAQVGVVMCAREAGREYGGRGADACNLGHVAYGDSDAQGNVTLQFVVQRLVVLDRQEIDCAAEAGRCLIGMGLLSDYDQSGGVLVEFDPSAPLPDPPTVELSKTAELADGERARLRVGGLLPGSSAFVDVCAGESCSPVAQSIPADADGAFDVELTLWRMFAAWDSTRAWPVNVDCAVVVCRLSVYAETPGNRSVPPVDLSFSPGGEVRTPPTMRLLDPGPFAVGQQFRVELTGLAGVGYVDVQSCSPQGECVAYGGREFTADGPVVVDVRVERVDGSCTDACVLWANVFAEGSDGSIAPSWSSPPPLVPEPVTFAVTG